MTKIVWKELKKKVNNNSDGIYKEVKDRYLGETYYFTGSGLVFSYDRGEIAPQTAVGFEATVPYKSVKSFIKKDSVIWNLVK